ncbi:tripartite tricarboxylate transporter TctB family protein [Dongia deserti]|uniref:tripartite tricarboxylate transporter TctB family protein n=1 Tax=Dongia deserti TaxID=2268030 RepID=UPI000E6528DC|nr:tripartite tricarboxylate transporter TctB family protein [Dongia deserti]
MKRGAAAAELVLGLGIAALGAFLLWETGEIRVSPVYAKVGPRVIPNLVGGIMTALGLLLAWQNWRAMQAAGPAPSRASAEDRTDWLPIGAIAIALIQQILLFELLGFMPTAAILFYCVAYGFGSRRYLRDALIAIAIAVVAYVGFVHVLGLNLPAGSLFFGED